MGTVVTIPEAALDYAIYGDNSHTVSNYLSLQMQQMPQMFNAIASKVYNAMMTSYNYVNDAMRWGAETELLAKEAYQTASGNLLDACGFILHPSIEYFGASPDAMLDDDAVVEFKCPTSTTHIGWLLAGVMPDQHKPQVLAQLACTQRTRAVFVSFDPRMPANRQLFIKEWTPTAAEIEAVETAAREFLRELDAMFQQLAEAA